MKTRLCIAALLLCLSVIAMAQTDVRLDTVTVAAAKRVHTQSAQSMAAEDFTRRGITSLTDAVSRMSGVNIRDYGGAGGVKTLSVHSLGAGHTGVAYDGMMVGDSESGQIDLSRFSLEQIDSLALTVGDGSNIFTPARSLSSAATLHLSKQAPVRNSFGARLSAGSFGHTQTDIDAALTLPHSWSLRAQGEWLRADNQYPFTLTNVQLVTREKRHNNAISRGYGELNLYHAHDFMLKLYYYEVTRGLPGAVIYYNPVSHEHDRYRNAFAQTRWQHSFTPWFSLQANARGAWSGERYSDYNLQYVNPDTTRLYLQTELYASVSGLFTLNRHLDASLAADYTFQQLKSQTLECERPYRHSALEAMRLRWHSRQLTATAGVLMSSYINRVDRGQASTDCHRLSPSASVAYTPLHWLTARVYYKDIFRPATLNDNYYTRSGTRNLRPEKARNLGLGLDLSLNRRHATGTLELEAYRAWVSDKIVAMPQNAFFWSMVNVGRVSVWGFEARLHGKLHATRWLSIEPHASYTLQHALNTTDPKYAYYRNQIAYTPRHTVSGSLSLLTPWLNVAVSGSGMSERWSTNANLKAAHIKGHQVWNISAWRDFKLNSHSFGLRAELLNVADSQYDIVRLYPMPGRSYKVTMTIKL